jgi:nucleotide-binding universal stress UspA family protein
MPETIVCGVDRSDAAEAVADTARWLANRLQARLVLMHVAEEPMAEAEELVASIRVRLRLGARDDVRLVEGSPQERLLAAADQDDADRLVVGSRGRGTIRSAVFGSVSRSLATNAPCPVVVVPPKVGGRGAVTATARAKRASSAASTAPSTRWPQRDSALTSQGGWVIGCSSFTHSPI